MTLDIRAARPADIPAVGDVGRRTWPATYGFAGEDYVAHGLATWWSDEALRRSLAGTTMLVAVAGEEIVGVGNIDLRADVPVIWKLYVVPGAQHRGVGSALLGALLDRAPADAPVRLEYVDGNEPAARFYARHGFVEIRREPDDRAGWPDAVWLEHAPRSAELGPLNPTRTD